MQPLTEYQRKRNFKETPEPRKGRKKGTKGSQSGHLIFVVQEHHASHLHYDFRLEWNGVLKSWAVPKGPSMDPRQKRLAVQVEDHPYSYAKFQGVIPPHQYGSGEVYRWDFGTWEPLNDATEGLKRGRLEFRLKGKKLHGDFLLIRTKAPGRQPSWLLIKRHDKFAAEDAASFINLRSPAGRERKAPRPTSQQFISPQLAQLVDKPPKGKDWVHEIKFDGYRTQAHVTNGKVQLLTRTGLDWTSKYPSIAESLSKLKSDAVIDGEVVWLDENGRSNFQRLQNALKVKKTSRIVFYAFDLLAEKDKSVTSLPLIARKERLKHLIAQLAPNIRFSEHFRGVADEILSASCRHDLEGVVSKRVDSVYSSGRGQSWVKSKCLKRQEFVIGGYTEGEGSRAGFGSLLVGFYQKNKLRYAGRCGTGFDQQTLLDLGARLRKIEVEKSPFSVHSPKGKGLHWVDPKLVAEVAFSEWTKDGVMRVPRFYGLRSDKPPREIGIEKVQKLNQKLNQKLKQEPAETSVALTHPDRVVFAKEGLTKADVNDYYKEVSKWLLAYVSERPLSLVRCPQGSAQKCFYSKHMTDRLTPDILPVEDPESSEPYIAIDSEAGLLTLVQRGTLELHPWNCQRGNLERPDQIVMDFDPDESVDFEAVKEGAWELKEILDDLKLKSFLKVTGGKGLHVQFPFVPNYDWRQVKNFARTLALEMTSRHPKLYTADLAKKARRGKIFLDYLRNGRGATAVAPYSLRSRAISAVAMPISWDELEGLPKASVFTLEKSLSYLKSRKTDPWKSYLNLHQRISILEPRNK